LEQVAFRLGGQHAAPINAYVIRTYVQRSADVVPRRLERDMRLELAVDPEFAQRLSGFAREEPAGHCRNNVTTQLVADIRHASGRPEIRHPDAGVTQRQAKHVDSRLAVVRQSDAFAECKR